MAMASPDLLTYFRPLEDYIPGTRQDLSPSRQIALAAEADRRRILVKRLGASTPVPDPV